MYLFYLFVFQYKFGGAYMYSVYTRATVHNNLQEYSSLWCHIIFSTEWVQTCIYLLHIKIAHSVYCPSVINSDEIILPSLQFHQRTLYVSRVHALVIWLLLGKFPFILYFLKMLERGYKACVWCTTNRHPICNSLHKPVLFVSGWVWLS